jgi:hypothetical protein
VDVQSAALWQPLGAVSPASEDESPLDESTGEPPSSPETHVAVPFASVHCEPDGHPAVEQSPVWHCPFAPHTSQAWQSLCCVHAPPTPESPSLPATHVWLPEESTPQEYPFGQSFELLHCHDEQPSSTYSFGQA